MKSSEKKKLKINNIYTKLDKHFGDLAWWPADSDFEVMVGAILTQNTSWKNVEKAIGALKKQKIMTPEKILAQKGLSQIIRSAGFHTLKAERLKALCGYLLKSGGKNFELLKHKNIREVRKELLQIKGIGPETADSILLYALQKSVFVVDSYTRRIMSRHGIVQEKTSYDEIQEIMSGNFSRNIKKLKQYHALIVETAKKFCKKSNPICRECPLNGM